MKICPVEANFFHTDMWTGMMKLMFSLRYCFVNTPKNAHSGFCLIWPCHPCGFLHRNAKCSCDICSKFYGQCVEQPQKLHCVIFWNLQFSVLKILHPAW